MNINIQWSLWLIIRSFKGMSFWRLSILPIKVLNRFLLIYLDTHVMIIPLFYLSKLFWCYYKVKLFIHILPFLLTFLLFRLLCFSCCKVLLKFIHDLDEIIKSYFLSILNFKSLNNLVKLWVVSLKSFKDFLKIVFGDLILI